jgi:hypothetical protein
MPRGYPTRAAVVLPDGQMLEALPDGVAVGRLSRYRRRPVLYAAPPLTEEQRNSVAALAEEYAGVQEQMTGPRLCVSFFERLGSPLFTDGRSIRDVRPGDLYQLFDDLESWR